MEKYKADSITMQVVKLFKQINVQLIALNYTDGGFNTDLNDFKVLSEKAYDLYSFLNVQPDNDIINQFKAIETVQVLKATTEGYFKSYSQSVIDLLENVDKIKSIEAKIGSELIPESLSFNISDERLQELYDSFRKYVLDSEDLPEKCYFNYAIRGDQIPTEKLPYKPITILNGTKASLYELLLDLERENNPTKKTLYNQYQIKSGVLFQFNNGDPIKKLQNPKK